MIRAILTSGSMRSLRHKSDRSCATKPGHISCHRQSEWRSVAILRSAATMNNLSRYSAVEHLRDGRALEIRALHSGDRDGMLAAVDHTSERSLHRRFFGAKRHFTDKEVEFFLNVDFTNHVALVAVAGEDGARVIVGGGRYVITRPKQAEVAFAVVDRYQGQGIGAALMRHLVGIARA